MLVEQLKNHKCSFVAKYEKNSLAFQKNKYLVREIFHRLYPNLEVPSKIPMSRPMTEWLKDWEEPKKK